MVRLREEQRDYELRFEALRVLLEARGKITHADFEISLAEMTKLGAEAFQAGLEAYQQGEKERQLERLRDMLRRHEGTKQ